MWTANETTASETPGRATSDRARHARVASGSPGSEKSPQKWLTRAIVPAIAIAVVAVGSLICWLGLHKEPRIGVDDALITQVYARNIAKGLGYVFYPGGPKVEGSTSPTWTLLNAVVYLLRLRPSFTIGLLCLALTTGSVFEALKLSAVSTTSRLSLRYSDSLYLPSLAAVLIAATPSFFAWAVFSQLDVSLWIFLLTLLCSRSIKILVSEKPVRIAPSIILISVLTTWTRPEAFLIVPAYTITLAMLALVAGLRRQALWLTVAFMSSCSAALILTLLRESYFGVPLPNTFYAKVSSDEMTTLKTGLAYLRVGYVTLPVLIFGFLSWLGFLFFREQRVSILDSLLRSLPVLILLVLLPIATLLEGGDHFHDQRLLQPLVPLSAAGIAALCGRLFVIRDSLRGGRSEGALMVLAAVAALALILQGFLSYKDDPNTSVFEFTIANAGVPFGTELASLSSSAPPSVGVIAAGGLPLGFDGISYDLEGLNWPEMAHAQRLKKGPNGHGSFDRGVFYKARPDILAIDTMPLPKGMPIMISRFNDEALKGLFHDSLLRNDYLPAVLDFSGDQHGVFVSKSWLAKVRDRRVRPASWNSVIFSGT